MEAETQKHRRKWIPARQTWGIRIGILAALLVPALTLAAACGGGGRGGGDDAIAIGQPVEPVTLPDIVSGEEVSLDDYLGKQEIVIVGYMGFF